MAATDELGGDLEGPDAPAPPLVGYRKQHSPAYIMTELSQSPDAWLIIDDQHVWDRRDLE